MNQDEIDEHNSKIKLEYKVMGFISTLLSFVIMGGLWIPIVIFSILFTIGYYMIGVNDTIATVLITIGFVLVAITLIFIRAMWRN